MSSSPSKPSSIPSLTNQQKTEESPTANLTSNTNLLTIAHKNDFYNILQATNNRLLVVEFFAHWCGPCKTLSPKLEKVAQAYNGKILVIKVDVDEFEELALEYDVSAMPTFMLMKNQQKLEQFSSSSEETLDTNLEKYVGKPELNQMVGVGEENEKEEAVKGKVKQKGRENKGEQKRNK